MKHIISSFVLLNRKRTWLEIVLMGVMIAIGISAFSTAQCALGQCGQRDQWCNPDCSQACTGTGGAKSIETTGIVYEDKNGMPFCDRNTTVMTTVPYQCRNSNNCNATRVLKSGYHLFQCGNYSCINLQDQRVPSSYIPGVTRCEVRIITARIDCCSAPSPDPTPRPTHCIPAYEPPQLIDTTLTPPYPIVIGQDPDKVGVDITVNLEGGEKTNSCKGPAKRNLTIIDLSWVDLSQDSRIWILTDLAQWYPGAHIKDIYPLHPLPDTTINGATGTLTFHIDPLDPGTYEAMVIATQDDGQSAQFTINVPVWLLETTMIQSP